MPNNVMWGKIKKVLQSIHRQWFVSLIFKGIKLIYEQYIYQPLNRGRYRNLSRFKNCHKNERCFIIATGPSLRLEDVNKLKGEITLSVNSIYKLFDKTDWRPTYYGISDSSVYDRIKDDIEKFEFNTIFYPDRYSIKSKQRNVNYVPVHDIWCSNAKQRVFIPRILQKRRFGLDLSHHLYIGTSVIHFMVQIAFYMGFKEIYLLGTDCTNPSQHSNLTTYKNSDRLSNTSADIYKWLMIDYDVAKKMAAKQGIKIYNTTRGGALEKFERVNLDNILNRI